MDSSELRDFADDYFKFDEFDEYGRKLSEQVQNTVGKGEIARYENVLKGPFSRIVKAGMKGVMYMLYMLFDDINLPICNGAILDQVFVVRSKVSHVDTVVCPIQPPITYNLCSWITIPVIYVTYNWWAKKSPTFSFCFWIFIG